MAKVVVRIKGGIGNQLFIYAAARRLALANHAELVLDDTTGFARDRHFKRDYELDHFNVHGRKATRSERMEPMGSLRHFLARSSARRKPFAQRRYVEQEGYGFEERLLDLNVEGTLFLEGYWQSKRYFEDIEPTIRSDLQITPPEDGTNRSIASQIRSEPSSVAIHMRWFDPVESESTDNTPVAYYRRAIGRISETVASPVFYVFSDDPQAALDKLGPVEGTVKAILHNQGPGQAYADLWLMTQCRHFITANSSFSWWGAWLGGGHDKVVVTPDPARSGSSIWGLNGLIPEGWIRV